MHSPRRALSVVLAAATVALAPIIAAQQRTPVQPPKLVVLMVVDQMRADYVARYRRDWRGGLKRLLDRGAWFRNAAYPYAATETCPGHATVGTGVFPSSHGIVANAWFDRAQKKVVACTEDTSVRPAGASNAGSRSDSASSLNSPTFAEQLRAARSGSRVVSIGVKARSAVMLAGSSGDVVLWLDDTRPQWLTSSAYAPDMPGFVRDFLDAHPLSADLDKTWQFSVKDHHSPFSAVGVNPPGGWNATSPRILDPGTHAPDVLFLSRWRASPFSDEYAAQLARAAVDAMHLGSGSATDFLGLGFAALDYTGHAFGPDSPEVEDVLFRLDQTLANLFAHLDRAVGFRNYVVALTADHGVAPIPEQARTQGLDAGRVDAGAIVARIESVLDEQFGPDRYVSTAVGDAIYLQPGVLERISARPEVWPAIEAAVTAMPGVQAIYRNDLVRPITSAALLSKRDRARALNQFPGRSGDMTVELKPYWILSGRANNETNNGWFGGTTHGSAAAYDQQVPIIFFGAGIKPGQYAESSTPADIAPTLAAVTGIQIARTDGRVLTEALASRPQVLNTRKPASR